MRYTECLRCASFIVLFCDTIGSSIEYEVDPDLCVVRHLENLSIEPRYWSVITELCGSSLDYLKEIEPADFASNIPAPVARGIVRKLRSGSGEETPIAKPVVVVGTPVEASSSGYKVNSDPFEAATSGLLSQPKQAISESQESDFTRQLTTGNDEVLSGVNLTRFIIGIGFFVLCIFAESVCRAAFFVIKKVTSVFKMEFTQIKKFSHDIKVYEKHLKEVVMDDTEHVISGREAYHRQGRMSVQYLEAERAEAVNNLNICIKNVGKELYRTMPRQLRWVIGPLFFYIGCKMLIPSNEDEILGFNIFPVIFIICQFIMVSGAYFCGSTVINVVRKHLAIYAKSTAAVWDDVLIEVFGQTSIIIWFIVCVIIILHLLGYDTTSLSLMLASFSVVIAFAVASCFSDWIGLLVIICTNIFTVGDWIIMKDNSIGKIDGRVETITLSKTMVRGWDRHLYVIPNSKFLTACIFNGSLSQRTLIKLNWHIQHGENMEKAAEAMLQIEKYMHEHPHLIIGTGIHPRCTIEEIEAEGYRVEVYCYFDRGGIEMRTQEPGPGQMAWFKDWQLMKQDLICYVERTMREHDIAFGCNRYLRTSQKEPELTSSNGLDWNEDSVKEIYLSSNEHAPEESNTSIMSPNGTINL